MKKVYLLYVLLFAALDGYTQTYCNAETAPTGIATTNSEDEIFNISITSAGLNQNSDCTSNPGGTSVLNRYSNYFATQTYLLPIGTHTLSLTRGPDCNGAHTSTAGAVVFIDYDQNGNWTDAGERVLVFANSINQNQTVTGSFTVPSNAKVGLTRMRVMLGENMTGTTQAPCTNYTWGETEDYAIFIGKKKWDYAMSAMFGPDSISFCGEGPVVIKTRVDNVENQPIEGGRVDLFVKGLEPGSTTNLFFTKAFTQTVASGSNTEVVFEPIQFPKDELLEFKYIVFHPLDSNKGNDTLVKRVQVYKNPVYQLKGIAACADTLSQAMIYNKPLPLFHKWSNESIVDTTNFAFSQPATVYIDITRGWKCSVRDSIAIAVKPLPKLMMPRDTILCLGQFVNLHAEVSTPNSFFEWEENNSHADLTVNSAKYYLATARRDGCSIADSTKVSVVKPPEQPLVLDTVCAGDIATVGLSYVGTDLKYEWAGRSESTPLINPIPTITNGIEKYYVQWWYAGCTDRDTVSLKVNPLPNVTLSTPTPAICPYFSSTLTVSGAKRYFWRNDNDTSLTKTVSPMTTTDYIVRGTDLNGCSKEIVHRQFVYPMPDMKVYSNKRDDNICLGDSATIYVNGGKTYSWSTGSTASIIKTIPTESFQWSVIGTDHNGCKDTMTYRMNVKPAFSVTPAKGLVGCTGDSVLLKVYSASGSKYNWGGQSKDTTDSYKVPIFNSTSYQVTVTSPENCDIITSVPVAILKKPDAQVSDLTICSGKTGILEAKGGDTFRWDILGQTQVTSSGNNHIGVFTGASTSTIGVEVTNIAGCKDTAYTTVNVINTEAVEVVFKSPLDEYNCASPQIPITLSATPSGGVWSGTNVIGNKLSPAGLNGTIEVMYSFFEPINNCKVERKKTVTFKCTSGINQLGSYEDWTVYPMPFSQELTVKYTSNKAETAQLYIYDLSGREVYHTQYRVLHGENLISLNQLPLAKGSYYLDFQTETVSRQAKIIAQ